MGTQVADFKHLLCPLDGLPLHRNDRCLVCLNGHQFDLAKSDYVNLLPVQNKRSKDPGDSKEMVAARRQFLDGGYYGPILDAISKSLPMYFNQSRLHILDAGCGEGYYLSHLHNFLTTCHQEVVSTGIDISKWAIVKASKTSREIDWIVGSNAHLPKVSESQDLVMCLFGFPVMAEFHRVLNASGMLLMIDAADDHLIELRRLLYPTVHNPKASNLTPPDGFELTDLQRLTFHFTLESQTEIQALLAMTPHIHKAPYAGREAIAKVDKLNVTSDVVLRWYKKINRVIT